MSGRTDGGWLARPLLLIALVVFAGALWQANLARTAAQITDGLRMDLATEQAETARQQQAFADLRAALADAPPSRVQVFETSVPTLALAVVDAARRAGLGVTQRVFASAAGLTPAVERSAATDTGDGLLHIGFQLDLTARTRAALDDWFQRLAGLPVRLVSWRLAGEQAHVELLLFGE